MSGPTAASVRITGVPSSDVSATTVPPPQRVVTVEYSLPAGYTTGDQASLLGSATATGIAHADEDKVTVSVTDVSGRVALLVDVTPAGGVATRRSSCEPLVLGVSTGLMVEATPLAGRCPDVTALCRAYAPALEPKAPGHLAACHYAPKDALAA